MILNLKVVPKSSREFISWYDREKNILKLNIQSPAIEGRANKSLIEFLAKYFSVKKSQVRIKSGETAKIKLIEIDADENFIVKKLKEMDPE